MVRNHDIFLAPTPPDLSAYLSSMFCLSHMEISDYTPHLPTFFGSLSSETLPLPLLLKSFIVSTRFSFSISKYLSEHLTKSN